MAIPPADDKEAAVVVEPILCGIRVEPHAAPPTRTSRHCRVLIHVRIGNFNVAPNDPQGKPLTTPFDRHGWAMVKCRATVDRAYV
jgi:hypothetical protein